MKKVSKRIQKRDAGIDFAKTYGFSEALALLKDRSSVKFDETVDMVFVCALDTRKGDQNIRGMVSLPKGSGKTLRVAVFAQGEQATQAQKAGADIVGAEDLVAKVEAGHIDFDVCIATPSMMVHLAKLGRVLGPKGLMPNPKLGTVTMDTAGAVTQAKQGQVTLRADKQGIVHSIVGRLNFGLDDLKANAKAVHEGLERLRPSGIKGNLIKRAYLSSTMGFALQLDLANGLS
jgi:large subunit ribosomal protein L1